MRQVSLGRVVRCAVVSGWVLAALVVATGATAPQAKARAFVGFGFGFPGFVGPPVYIPPPPLVVYRPPPVYPPPFFRPISPVVFAPPPPPVKQYRRPVRHHRVCRCYYR